MNESAEVRTRGGVGGVWRRLAIVCLVAGFTALPCIGSGARPPNIVYIMADDAGYGDFGPFGQRKIHTPALDRMASEGTKFTDFYAGASVCAPTRCVLMTGMHTGHARVRGNRGLTDVERVPLRPEDITVAEVLRTRGYRSAIIGKWGIGEAGSTGIPTRQGFDLFYGYLNQDLAVDYYPEKLWRNEEEVEIPGNRGGAKGSYSNDLFTDEALQFIDGNRSRPFFLYLAYTIPHATWEVPADSFREYAGRFPEDPSVHDPDVTTDSPRTTYAAMVTRLDGYVGRILARLKELGLDRDTVMFFTSDNGPEDTAGVATFFDSTGPFRGVKGTVSEGAIRAPMIVRWPGKVAAGRTSNLPWAGWDFLPTAAALAGVAAPAGVDGISVVPALEGKPMKREAPLYWEVNGKHRFAQAIRRGNLKAVREGLKGRIEVYDLSRDPAEAHDIASSHPDFVKYAERMFRSDRSQSKDWPVPPPGTPPAWQRDRAVSRD